MGLGHLLGLDDGGGRWRCADCGRLVRIDSEDLPDDGAPTCPECGSTDLRRLLLL